MNYKALYAIEENGKLEIGITNKQLDDKLNPDEVLIKVQYSSLNYKDAMALNGNMAKIMRKLPMSPGIDLSGTVEMSSSKNFNEGDEVLVTGFGMGEKFSGGYSQYVKIDSKYVVKKPNNITLRESMIIGTAGFTAMLAVDEIIQSNFDKSRAKILISGSTGGVASISIGLLSNMGYQISTLTSKNNQDKYLKSLGANEVISTHDFLESNSKPLNSSKWMGAIDTLGGKILSNILASMNYGGIVISTGNALSNDLPTTVLPFILRKIKLVGIDSVYAPISYRNKIWESYSQLICKDTLNKIATEIYLEDLNSYAIKMLDGKLKGRVIINIKDS